MKKIKTVGYQFTNSFKPEARYVLRIESDGNGLAFRYFKEATEEEISIQTPVSELSALNIASTPLMRVLVTDATPVAAEAVTADARMAGKTLREFGRHIFRPNIGDDAVTGAGEEQDFPIFVLPFGTNGQVSEPYNHLVESSAVKGSVPRNGRLRGAQPIFVLHAQKADAPLADWTCVYIDSPPFIVEDTTAGTWTDAPKGFKAMDLLPTLELSGPSQIAKDGTATMQVTMKQGAITLSYSGDIAVETLAGYAPKTRVSMVNGSASFKVMALGLDVGDQMRVKVGTRTVSGMADKTLEVVATT